MYFKKQAKVIKQRDPAIKSSLEVLLYPSFWAVLFHRLGHRLYVNKHFFLARFISQLSRGLTGIEIHPGAQIKDRFFVDHGAGVVIGETCRIGSNVLLYQGVTLGGTGKGVGRRHPIIGNNVLVGAGAKVLGPIKVGDNTFIGAGSVVLTDIPANCTVVGIPGRVVKQNGVDMKSHNETLNQNLPDIISQEIDGLKQEVKVLRNELGELSDSIHSK